MRGDYDGLVCLRGTHHTPKAFDHQVFGQPMLDDPVRGNNHTPQLAEVPDTPSLQTQRTSLAMSASCGEPEENKKG